MKLVGSLTTDRSNQVDSGKLQIIPFVIENQYGGRVDVIYQHTFERPLAFTLPDGLTVDSGAYHFEEARIKFNGSRNWPLTGDLLLGGGEYFDGARIIFIPEVEWRPNRHFLVKGRYQLNETWLPGQRGRTHIFAGEVAIFFTPDISWSTLVQYDNVSDSIGLNSRLHWIIEDGREVFLVLNQGVDIIDGELKRGVTQPIVKLAWTFRF